MPVRESNQGPANFRSLARCSTTETMGATFWSSPSGDLSCHFDPSPLGRGLHHHDEDAGHWCSTLYAYLLPETLWNVWSLASSLSNNTILSFQWVPGHAGLPSYKKADVLAKTGASLPSDAIPCPLFPIIAKVSYSQYRNWRRHFSHSHLNFQVPEVSLEELLLSCSIRCELSRLLCRDHSLLLSSYLHRISRKENSACSACGHSLQDLNHLLLDCPAFEPIRKSIFGSSLSILDLWSRPWGVARLLGLRGVPPRTHPSEEVG